MENYAIGFFPANCCVHYSTYIVFRVGNTQLNVLSCQKHSSSVGRAHAYKWLGPGLESSNTHNILFKKRYSENRMTINQCLEETCTADTLDCLTYTLRFRFFSRSYTSIRSGQRTSSHRSPRNNQHPSVDLGKLADLAEIGSNDSSSETCQSIAY